jgi:hypothetical protein
MRIAILPANERNAHERTPRGLRRYFSRDAAFSCCFSLLLCSFTSFFSTSPSG